MADNWLTDGNCNECRKNKYCKKSCSMHEKRKNIFIHNAFSKTKFGQLFDHVQETIDNSNQQ